MRRGRRVVWGLLRVCHGWVRVSLSTVLKVKLLSRKHWKALNVFK